MSKLLQRLALALVWFAVAVASGCGNNNTPVIPDPIETTPTSDEPKGAEPQLPEEGP
jgi:hypothetical protein